MVILFGKLLNEKEKTEKKIERENKANDRIGNPSSNTKESILNALRLRWSYDDLCQHKRAIVQINQGGRDCSELYLGAKTLLEDAPSNMHTTACWNIVGKNDF